MRIKKVKSNENKKRQKVMRMKKVKINENKKTVSEHCISVYTYTQYCHDHNAYLR